MLIFVVENFFFGSSLRLPPSLNNHSFALLTLFAYYYISHTAKIGAFRSFPLKNSRNNHIYSASQLILHKYS